MTIPYANWKDYLNIQEKVTCTVEVGGTWIMSKYTKEELESCQSIAK